MNPVVQRILEGNWDVSNPFFCYLQKLNIIRSGNGLSPGRCRAIVWTNAGILLIGPMGTNLSEILIEIITFSFKKMQLKMASANGVYFVSASMCKIKNELNILYILWDMFFICKATGSANTSCRDLYSLCRKMSCHQISRSLENVRLGIKMIASLWNWQAPRQHCCGEDCRISGASKMSKFRDF